VQKVTLRVLSISLDNISYAGCEALRLPSGCDDVPPMCRDVEREDPAHFDVGMADRNDLARNGVVGLFRGIA
jgi:hypothetical protein